MHYALYPYQKNVGWICPECRYHNEPDDYVCVSDLCIDLRAEEELERDLEVFRQSLSSTIRNNCFNKSWIAFNLLSASPRLIAAESFTSNW
jgi:hypothetical protein